MQTVLCFNSFPKLEVNRREFDGVRRFADTCGWRLLLFPAESSDVDSVRTLIARHRPAGCIVGPNPFRPILPSRVFGKTPVVWLVPQNEAGRGATCVAADNAAIAGAAFRELAAGLPKCFAAVPAPLHRPWSAERIAEFRRLCREAGTPCRVFPVRRGEADASRLARMRDWVAALPLRCAVFAVNDLVAYDVAAAANAIPRHIPKELVLIGVDALTVPSSDDSRLRDISSVEVDFEGAGYAAAKMLAELMKGTRRPSCATFGPLLVLRRRSTQGRGGRDPDILGAIDIIRREACDGLTAEKLAARFPGSRKHFERRFRLVMGHSVLDEILHVRFEKAKTLLVQTEMPLGSIAAQCGFGTETNLRKHFHLRDGTSPRQWRREHVR